MLMFEMPSTVTDANVTSDMRGTDRFKKIEQPVDSGLQPE